MGPYRLNIRVGPNSISWNQVANHTLLAVVHLTGRAILTSQNQASGILLTSWIVEQTLIVSTSSYIRALIAHDY